MDNFVSTVGKILGLPVLASKHGADVDKLIIYVHLLMGALVVARLLHPLGMYAAPDTFRFRIGRIGGVTITIGLLVTCALSILSRLA